MKTSQNVDSSVDQSQEQWSRLSPISVLFFLGKSISSILKDALPGLAPLGVLIFNSENKTWVVGLVIAGIVLLTIVSAVLQYLFFKYRLQEDKILINDGVFKKRQRTLEHDRIQNVNIIQPVYFKIFDLVTLNLETAGSKGNEANLAGISRQSAEKIKQNILAKAPEFEDSIVENSEPIESASTSTLATANLNQLVQYGLTSNAMFWFLIFLAPLFGALDDVIENWIGDETVDAFVNSFGGGLKGGLVLIAVALFSLLFVMLLFSITGSILRFYKYHLTQEKDTLRRHSGLISTHEESLKLSKIQAMTFQTNFIGLWLKAENITIKQASTQVNNESSRSNLFIIPSRVRQESIELLKRLLGVNKLPDLLDSVDRRYIRKNTLILSVPVFILSIILWINSSSLLSLLPLSLTPLIWLFYRQKWKQLGYKITSHFGFVRKGVIGYRYTCLPLFKVQRVSISQSFLQKRNNLATLTLYMASESITIPYIPMRSAVEWFDKISTQIETRNENWF
ncbi:PH domain-containing protein [Aliikangiella sp. G2MR2-5]|uniref:PH domain-containing protein n=1 Tax=Aliikangiella sp. G2MR2-5 TaxID=2788943 RepID=UPI0018A90345|nr:PH domain-containing protein [Aliikangiella sp. G2MR2-5]